MALKKFFRSGILCIAVLLGILALTPGVAPANRYSVFTSGENWSLLSFGFIPPFSGPNTSVPAFGSAFCAIRPRLRDPNSECQCLVRELAPLHL